MSKKVKLLCQKKLTAFLHKRYRVFCHHYAKKVPFMQKKYRVSLFLCKKMSFYAKTGLIMEKND